MIIQHELRWIK